MQKLQKKLMIWALMGAFAMSLAAPAMAQTSADTAKGVVEAAQIYKDGKTDEALARFESLEKTAPNNPDVLSWLGFLYIQKDMADKAVPVLERAVAARPNDIEIRNNLGNAYVATRQDDKAMEQYTAITKLNTRMYEPYYNIGGIELRRSNYQSAVDAYRKALELSTGDAYVYNNLGMAYEGLKNDQESANCYAKACSLKPDNILFNRNAGFAYLRLKDDARAETYLAKAAAGDDQAATKLALFDIYNRTGRTEMARKMLEEVQGTMGESAQYWYNLGVVRARLNDVAGAEEAYGKALALNEGDRDTVNNLALLYYRNGKYAEALPLFERLAGAEGSGDQDKLNYAACLLKVGRTDDAVGIWKSFLHGNGARTDVRLDLAAALWQRGDYEGARYHYVEVLKTDANNTRALNGVGLYQYQFDKLADAVKSFTRVIELDSKFLAAYNNLAVTYERQNKMKLAIATLEAALKINPNFEDAKRNLARMRKVS